MSLAAFQRGLCALIASPALCRSLRRDSSELPAAWDLTPLERRRLVAIACHRGMSANCSVYRATRLTPLWTLLPRSCFLLGVALQRELDRYWEGQSATDLQFSSEVDAFAAYVRTRLDCRRLAVPYLRETLAFELAMHHLPLLLGGTAAAGVAAASDVLQPPDGPLRQGGTPQSPQSVPAPRALRALRFTREPAALLARLDERLRPPYPDLAPGEFWLLLDARSGELRSSSVAPAVGRAMARLHAGRPLAAVAAATLWKLGLIGPGPSQYSLV
jgi:hypothetical protein